LHKHFASVAISILSRKKQSTYVILILYHDNTVFNNMYRYWIIFNEYNIRIENDDVIIEIIEFFL